MWPGAGASHLEDFSSDSAKMGVTWPVCAFKGSGWWQWREQVTAGQKSKQETSQRLLRWPQRMAMPKAGRPLQRVKGVRLETYSERTAVHASSYGFSKTHILRRINSAFLLLTSWYQNTLLSIFLEKRQQTIITARLFLLPSQPWLFLLLIPKMKKRKTAKKKFYSCDKSEVIFTVKRI